MPPHIMLAADRWVDGFKHHVMVKYAIDAIEERPNPSHPPTCASPTAGDDHSQE